MLVVPDWSQVTDASFMLLVYIFRLNMSSLEIISKVDSLGR